MVMSLLVKDKLGFVDGSCTRDQFEKDVYKLS